MMVIWRKLILFLKKNMKYKTILKTLFINRVYLLRIILSPIVLLIYAFITCVLFFFPIPMLCGITFFQLIAYPFILLFNICGSEIEAPEPFVNVLPESYLVGYLLTITIPIWGMFFLTVLFIINGKIWDGD